MKSSITVMVPAYNEEKYIKGVIIKLKKTLDPLFKEYEIIIFDDCSTDKTPKIVDEISKGNQRIRVIHNKKNKGLGYNFREGIQLAKMEYYMWFPGDGIYEKIEQVLENVGKADIIIPYILNQKDRPLLRWIISEGYVGLLNVMFNLRLRYYNGFVITKTKYLKKIKMTTNSFAFGTEALIRLIKRNYSYLQVPYYTVPETQKETQIFRLKNIFGVISTILRLFFEINIKSKF